MGWAGYKLEPYASTTILYFSPYPVPLYIPCAERSCNYTLSDIITGFMVYLYLKRYTYSTRIGYKINCKTSLVIYIRRKPHNTLTINHSKTLFCF